MPNIYAFLWRMSGRHQIGICAVSLMVAAISVAPIELQKRIVNEAVEAKDLSLLITLGLIFLAVILARRILKFILAMYQIWLSESATRFCREGLTEVWLASDDGNTGVHSRMTGEESPEDVETAASGEGQTVSVINSEIDQVGHFVGTGLSDPVADVAKLVFAFGYMIYVEPTVALVAICFFIPQFFTIPFLQRVLNQLIRKRTDYLRSMSDALVEPDRDSEHPNDKFLGRLDDIYDNRIKSEMFKQFIKAIVNILNSLAPLSVLVFGGYLYIQGSTSIGVIVAFMSGFDRMADPTRALVNYYRTASIKNEQHSKIAQWIEKALDNKKNESG